MTESGLLRAACRRNDVTSPLVQGNSETVIASEAKQSIVPRKERMDCFVASLLAMTSRRNFATSPRNAPEPLMNRPPKEGVGNAGCPLHPQPRVHFVLVERTRVNEYTGIARRSRTQWF
jgi:hypothetical protein